MTGPKPDQGARNCPACDSAEGAGQGPKNGFHMLSCLSCGTLYTAYLPDPAGAQDYDSYYGAENLSVPAFIERRLDEIVAGFNIHRRKNRLLDIGFGAGSLLQAASRDGWIAEGVEVSRPAIKHASALGFNVFCGTLHQARYPADSFDVVTASEILEHLPNPRELVREVARVLRPGGLFWATTPHSRGVSSRLLKRDWSVVSPPEHLQLFSLSGMKTLLAAAGFSRPAMATEGVNPFEILHSLRHKGRTGGDVAQEPAFDRVETGYDLNENLSKSPSRRMLKNLGNTVLNFSRLGDSLKIRAIN